MLKEMSLYLESPTSESSPRSRALSVDAGAEEEEGSQHTSNVWLSRSPEKLPHT